MSTFERQSERLSKNLKEYFHKILARIIAYFKRLLFPLYLFPLKLLTYSLYYFAGFSIKFFVALLKVIIDALIFPFRSLKNFIKSLFIAGSVLYMLASLFVITDYLRTQYGYFGKFLCAYGIRDNLQKKVVRIVGGYSEGSGFFIEPTLVITNFHVIADEPSPKIIFPDGNFITPVKIFGNESLDLALLYTEKPYRDNILALPEKVSLGEDEQLIAAGYPLGTGLSGKASIIKGRFVDFRNGRQNTTGYIQSDISLVEGMSGGPLTDQCGRLVGINTMGLAGLSLFINAEQIKIKTPEFTDQNIKKIVVDPAASPEEAVRAFYTYLKARRMQEGFDLLSREYLKKTDFREWTNRFTDILDVEVFISEPDKSSNNTVFVKFATKNWVNGEAEIHYYQGTWETVREDGVYKMLKSNIEEVEEPGWEWFYE